MRLVRCAVQPAGPNTAPTSARRTRAIVVGNGPLGSAAGRHLAEEGFDVTVFGSERLRSSSHDRGRIARGMDAEGNIAWAERNASSISAFRQLEKDTGIDFYTECGALIVGSKPFVLRAAQGGKVLAYEAGSIHSEFPFLASNPTAYATLDTAAGHVDPYRMVEAQNARAASLGATIVRNDAVERLEVDKCSGGPTTAGGVVAHLESGGEVQADVAVVCGGAYTSHLLSVSGIWAEDGEAALGSVSVSRRTVLLAEVSEEDATTVMARMPTVKWLHESTTSAPDGHSATEAASVYILPPIKYPEYGGRWFIKIGGGPNDFMESGGDMPAQLEEFYSGPGDTALAARLEPILRSVFPETVFLSITSKPCVTTCSPDGTLQLVALAGGKVLAATGCQGKAAMAADAIGRELTDMAVEQSGRHAPAQ